MTSMERHAQALRAAREYLAEATVESRMQRTGPFFRATVTTVRRDGAEVSATATCTREDLALDLAWESLKIDLMRDELDAGQPLLEPVPGDELYQPGPVGLQQVNGLLEAEGQPPRDRDDIFRAARGLLLASSSAEPPTVRDVVNQLPPQSQLPLSA